MSYKGKRAWVTIQDCVFIGTIEIDDEECQAIRLDSGELISNRKGRMAYRPILKDSELKNKEGYV